MALHGGQKLAHYEILVPLGRGGMGEVYRAKDRKLGREVALKILSPELAADPERLRRFEQEARAASALNHPNIVHIYDVGEAEVGRYIAMELVEGKTLRQLLASAPLAEELLLDLGRQLADGLAKAHAAGIVHRDLKPENVMVTEDGFVKILDFGLAKLSNLPAALGSDIATVARTRHGVLLGTVEYMSPEQAAGKSVGHRSDQFSLGLILYEMATGKIAFHRDTAAQTLASIIESDPPPLHQAAPRAPRGLDAVVRKCLAKDPEDRYEDTRELARELKALPREAAAPPSPAPLSPPPAPGLGAYIGREVQEAFGEVERELGEAFSERVYQIDTGDRVRKLSEARLRKGLRKNRYSGVEMVRPPGEERWIPLHDTQIFRDEVPCEGAAAERAAKRKVVGFLQHLGVFVTMGATMFFVTDQVPFWMGFWGIGLVSHAIGTAPAAMSLARRRRLAASQPQELASAPALDRIPESFRNEVARVRDLLARRGGADKEELVREVDGILDRMQVVAAMKRDLEEQTSVAERERLEAVEREAERRVRETGSARDRKLYQRQLDVVRQRRQTIAKALEVLERLRIRQDVAEHQVKQLRLDLARAEASSADVPELSSRLQDIRHEVDAIDEVDEALARELTS